MDDLLHAMNSADNHGYVYGKCTACGATSNKIEPNAEGGDCDACGAEGTVTSPLREAGMI